MLIHIASKREPKVRGVRRAFELLVKNPSFQIPEISIETFSVESGVSDTPKSIEELITGAQQRAAKVFANCDLSIGVEGGLFQVNDKVFLQSWCCVYDGTENFYGASGAIEIPPALSHEVLRNGADLGIIIDSFAEKNDVRSNQGTFGILTNNVVTREDSFALAAFNALVPIFNKKMYKKNLTVA